MMMMMMMMMMITPEKFENGFFSENASLFSVQVSPEKFGSATTTRFRSSSVLGAPFRVWLTHMIIVKLSFSKTPCSSCSTFTLKRGVDVLKFFRFEDRFQRASYSVDNFSELV